MSSEEGPVGEPTTEALPGPTATEPWAPDDERHASNLELFLDLVFVFAVTQIAALMAHDLTIAGVGRALLLLTLVWWQWSQFTWAGAAIDLQRSPRTRMLVLSTIPATLTMAAAIPDSYHETGPWFGLAYFGVQLLVLGMQGVEAVHRPETWSAFLRYGRFAAIAPIIVAVGGYLSETSRVWIWVAAAIVIAIGAMRASSAGEWSVSPVHFAERHALFVIICLGETLVTIGASATESGLRAKTLAGLIAASAVACMLWWSYFAFIPNAVEHRLRQATGVERGRVARNLFTFGHLPIVIGVIFVAVVFRRMVAEPTEPLPGADRWLLALGIAAAIGSYLVLQWNVVRAQSPERYAVIAAAALWCAVTGQLAGVVTVGVVAILLAVMQAITWRRFRQSSLSHLTANR